MIRILDKLFLTITMSFLDDIRVKGLYITYSNKEALFRIRRYVYEYIQNLDKTIDQIKRVRACIKAKLQFYYNGMNIVRYIYKYNSRTSTTLKVIKVLEQLACRNVTKGRAFIGIYIYYRIQIKDFITIIALIY